MTKPQRIAFLVLKMVKRGETVEPCRHPVGLDLQHGTQDEEWATERVARSAQLSDKLASMFDSVSYTTIVKALRQIASTHPHEWRMAKGRGGLSLYHYTRKEEKEDRADHAERAALRARHDGIAAAFKQLGFEAGQNTDDSIYLDIDEAEKVLTLLTKGRA